MKRYLENIKNILKHLIIYYIFQILIFIIIIKYNIKATLPVYKIKEIIVNKHYLVLSTSSILSLVTYIFIVNDKKKFFGRFKIKTNYRYDYIFMILISISWAFISYGGFLLSNHLSNDTLIKSLELNKTFFINIFYIVIIIPTFEEILFRGIIIDELIKFTNLRRGILLQATIFAILHGQPIQIIYNFFFGVILGLLYIWTESLWTSIVIHMSYNLMITFVIPICINKYIKYYKELWLIGVMLIIFSLNMIYKKTKMD